MRAVIIPIDLTQLSLTLDVKNAPCNSSSLSITGAVSGDPRDGSHPFSQAVHESMHFASITNVLEEQNIVGKFGPYDTI